MNDHCMLSKWRIFCNTEGTWSNGFGQLEPTVCYNDIEHEVNINSVQQLEGCDTKIAKLIDTKPSGTNGGTFNANMWNIRVLNNMNSNIEASVSLNSNEFTLQPGVYTITAQVPAYNVESHKSRLYNVTNDTVEVMGSTVYCASMGIISGSSAITKSELFTVINIVSTTVYRIEHNCTSTQIDTGLGLASGLGLEIYTVVIINKLL
jgi:hypothetical protein